MEKLRYQLVVSPKSIRRIEQKGWETHHVYLPVLELTNAIKKSGHPLPEGINPRSHDKLKGNIPKAIRNTIENSPEMFSLVNRGLTISAYNAKYDTITNLLTIDFGVKDQYEGDKALYGVLDGATTLTVLREVSEPLPDEESGEINIDHNLETAIVHLEIITGLEDREEIAQLAIGRNSSVAVKAFSIENFRGSYGWLLDCIKDMPYCSKIGLDENANGDLNILELTAILNLFNPYWKGDKMPDSYTSKQSMVDRYQEMEDGSDKANRNELFRKLTPIITEILTLHDTIKSGFYQASVDAKLKILAMGSRKGKRLFREYKKERPMTFTNLEQKCEVPTGVLFPLLGAFRALIGINKNGNVMWNTDPFEFWKNHRVTLVSQVMDLLSNFNDDPQTCGKRSTSYCHMYSQVQSLYAVEELSRMQKKEYARINK